MGYNFYMTHNAEVVRQSAFGLFLEKYRRHLEIKRNNYRHRREK